jgi:cullin 1
MLYGKYTESIR